MPIAPEDLKKWTEDRPQADLAALEGGERLRLRFVSFLALKHPGVLQAFLQRNDTGPYECELLMRDALSEVLKSRLLGVLAPESVFEILSEWSRHDEDAYELLTSLRRQEE